MRNVNPFGTAVLNRYVLVVFFFSSLCLFFCAILLLFLRKLFLCYLSFSWCFCFTFSLSFFTLIVIFFTLHWYLLFTFIFDNQRENTVFSILTTRDRLIIAIIRIILFYKVLFCSNCSVFCKVWFNAINNWFVYISNEKYLVWFFLHLKLDCKF